MSPAPSAPSAPRHYSTEVYVTFLQTKYKSKRIIGKFIDYQ